jgi:hypothetical protein
MNRDGEKSALGRSPVSPGENQSFHTYDCYQEGEAPNERCPYPFPLHVFLLLPAGEMLEGRGNPLQLFHDCREAVAALL